MTEFIPFRSRCLGTVTYASLVFSQDGNLTIIKENLSAYVRKWENHPTSFKQNIFPSFCYTFIHVVPSGFSSEIEKKNRFNTFPGMWLLLSLRFQTSNELEFVRKADIPK